ncbi:MAG: SusC/RagA family TonB-linked outer membrane protein [Bacteroidales bacterium]|nr:SusC/RagA family TonB-linked outer membrane protein [Bacteroidales bacterium]
MTRNSAGKLLMCILLLAGAGPLQVCPGGIDALAQQRQITAKGTVVDDDGEAVIGAVVSSKGRKGAHTTVRTDGTFSISVPEGTILSFSCLGYTETQMKASEDMEVTMTVDRQQIEETVIVGYTTENVRNISASVARVDMEKLEMNPSASITNMLAGQAAGLQTVTRSGVPGSSGSGIVIRGNNSLSSSNDITGISNPLYIIDGIPMSLQDYAGYNVTDNDFLSSLNPQDIASIDILKDAAATAIYGSRGANGVVIITTRKGTSGKARVTARISGGVIARPAKLAVYVGEEERQAKLDIINNTMSALFGDQEWFDIRDSKLGEVLGFTLPSVLTDKYNPSFNNAYDYQNMFYQHGSTQNYDLSMEGGNNSNSYRVSIGWYDEKGVLVGYGLKRLNIGSNLVTDLNKYIHNELVIRYSNMTRSGGLNDVMKAMPTSPIDLPSSLFYRSDAEIKQLTGQLGDAYNKNKSHTISIGETLRVTFLPCLTWDNQASLVMDIGRRDYFVPSTARDDNKSLVNAFSSITSTTNLNSRLNFNKTIKSHSIVAMLGTEVNLSTLNQLRAEATDGMSDYLKVLNGYKKEDITASSDIVTTNMLSFFGLVSYGFRQNRYKIEAVLRRDGSSRFGSNRKWATFPSVKAHWQFSEEPWMQWSKKALDFGKIRISYGSSGEIYYDPLLQYNSLVALGSMGAGLTYVGSNQMDVKTYGGNLALISDFNKIANKDLSWSRTQEINYGIDLEFFKRRLLITADLYSKYLSDLVYTSELPAYVGFNQIQTNLVDMVGHGFELSLTGYIFPRDSDIQWDWTLNLGNNHMYIAKLGNGGKDYINYGGHYAFIEGAPAFQYYMAEYLGPLDKYSDLPVDPFTGEALAYKWADAGLARNLQGRIFPGMPVFTDVDGDYLVDGYAGGNDQKIIEGKTPEPKVTGGLSTCFRFKDFQIRINSSFSFGNWIFNTTLQSQLSRLDDASSFYQYALYKYDQKQFWTEPGCGAYYPMMYFGYWEGGSARSFRESSMFLERGDYWNIDNVNISYNLPKKWMDKLKIRGINVYLTGTNLFMWKASKVLDPRMISRTGWYNGSGYPISQTYVIGTQIQF